MADNQAQEKPFFISHNSGFGKAEAKDELLHPEANSKVSADTLTETQYFGFCIPEERIHGYSYLWHHPNLHVLGGGIMAWRGHKHTATHAELCDYRDYMSDAALKNDLHDYRLDNGYGVKVVEPLKRHHLTYADPKRNHSVDLHYQAVMPPAMFANGNHFEQALKVTGKVVLRGKPYDVNCYCTRDRSWGKPRPEDNLPIGPGSWMVGVFNDDFAFSCNVADQVSGNPELANTPFALPDDKTLYGGWLWRDGKLGCAVKAKKRIVRVPASRIPSYVELELTDDLGRTVLIRGTAIASNAWQPWTNIFMPIVLMRWECEGMTAHGDLQEGVWNDYLNLP